MPGGCKSISNITSLHKSYTAKLFGPRVFCFSVGKKKFFFVPLKRRPGIFDEIRFGDFFFDPLKNKKPSVQKVPLLTFKIDYEVYGEV